MKQMTQMKQMTHIKTIYAGAHTAKKVGVQKVIGCGECQTSCQSACKTSCTVANQRCEQASEA